MAEQEYDSVSEDWWCAAYLHSLYRRQMLDSLTDAAVIRDVDGGRPVSPGPRQPAVGRQKAIRVQAARP
jgi:hypothetical protein